MLSVLPKDKSARPSPRQKKDTSRQTGPVEAQGLKVLIVDDVEDTRRLYEHFFNFKGVKVFTAADGDTAVRTAQEQLPDIIVLDLAMPRMTGWDVLRNLKADPRTCIIPVVVVSGQAARDSAIAMGAASYCEKPCLPHDLLTEVLRVLRELDRLN